jgi:hypothetical protein
MAIGINIAAFRDIFMSSMERLERLERTPKGRRQLAAEYRAEAKRLRESSGPDLWRNAGGEMNTHVASPAELARRALEHADDLEKQARRLDAIKGIHEPYADYLKGTP